MFPQIQFIRLTDPDGTQIVINLATIVKVVAVPNDYLTIHTVDGGKTMIDIPLESFLTNLKSIGK